MSDGSHIEWTDATWNPITGCDIESPGCIHCYAMTLAGTRLRNHPSRVGLTKQAANGAHVWTGEVRFNEQWLDQPLRWARHRMIFVCAHGDLFHPNVPDEWIDLVLAVIACTPRHTYQVLTKRAERMRKYFSSSGNARLRIWTRMARVAPSFEGCSEPAWPLPNCWLGISAEDQQRADERIAHLLNTPAAMRWISAEPLIGPIDYNALSDQDNNLNALTGLRENPFGATVHRWFGERIDWVVAGGESGNDARPMHADWIRGQRDQCLAAKVPFFFKQWGAWLPGAQYTDPLRVADPDEFSRFPTMVWDVDRWVDHNGVEITSLEEVHRVGKKAAGHVLDGREWKEYPRPRS